MKKSMILIIGILLIISSLSTYSFLNRDQDLGEVVAVSADHIEPMTVSSNYLQSRNYPVMVFLRGLTLGSILFGDDSPEVNPFFGGLNIRDFTVHLNSGHQYATVSKPIFPRGNNLRIGQNGEIDLGYMIVRLKRNTKEAEIPDEINLNLTAKFIFDSVSKFGVFGQQDLILTPTGENNFLTDSSGGRFWSGRGYLRLDNVNNKEARLELYDGSFNTISNFKLKEGREKEYSLRGGPSFLDNKLRIKLKNIITPQTNAILMIDEDYGLTRTTVVKGMMPFVGSSWTVRDISTTPRNIVEFVNHDGEIRALSGESIPGLNPCDVEVHINEDYLSREFKEADYNQKKCTAIHEYELALIYAEGNIEKEEAIYLKIAKTYEEIGAYAKSLEYYLKISSGVEESIFKLEEAIENKYPYIVLDDVVVFLQKVEEVKDTSYFLASVDKSEPEIKNKDDVMDLISTLAEDFEFKVPLDIALAVAKHESGGEYKHCKDHTYSCDSLSELISNTNKNDQGIVTSTDYGILMINTKAHPGCFDKNLPDRGICSVSECNGKTVVDLKCSIAAGLNFLRNNYDNYAGNYDLYKSYVENSCDNSVYSDKYLSYAEWDRALRGYNGFGCADKFANYVELINSNMDNNDIKNFEVSSGFLTGGDEEYVINGKLIEGNDFGLTDSKGHSYDWLVEDILSDKITIRTSPRNVYGETYTLRKGPNTVDGINVYVSDIVYTKAVIVSILPGSGRSYGSSEFTVTIPIEKRLITWTPEEIDNKIEKASNTVKKIDNALEKLGNIIEVWKGSCFITYYALVLKNSRSLAPRKAAITHYTDKCKEIIEDDPDAYGGIGIPEKLNNCLEYYEEEEEGILTYMEGYSRGIDMQENFLNLLNDKGLNHPDTKNYLKNYFGLTNDEKKLLNFMIDYNGYTKDLEVGSSITNEKIKKLILEKETGDSTYSKHKRELFDVSNLLEKYEFINGDISESKTSGRIIGEIDTEEEIDEIKGIIGSRFGEGRISA